MVEPLRDDEESDRPEVSTLFPRRIEVGGIEVEDIATARELIAATEGFKPGDRIFIAENDTLTLLGMAADGNLVRSSGSISAGYLHMSMAYHASIAMGAPRSFGEWANRGPRQFQFTEKFPQEVRERAWKLLEQFMNPSQYFAFMEGADIELENLAKDFRLIINKSGKFIILEGARGSGIVAQSGNVRSYKYPLGDEIAAFIDWFNHRTKELIAQWGCGTYGIVKEEKGGENGWFG